RSDVFAFGIVLFQLLTGELPFAGPNQLALLHNLHFNQPRDLRQLRPDVPDDLIVLIGQMLEKDPAQRVQTMPGVANALRQIAHEEQMSLSQEPALAPTMESWVARKPVPPKPAPWWKRQELWIAVLVPVLAGAIVIGRSMWKPRQQAVTSGTPEAI